MDFLSIFSKEELEILKNALENDEQDLISKKTCQITNNSENKVTGACFLTYPMYKTSKDKSLDLFIPLQEEFIKKSSSHKTCLDFVEWFDKSPRDQWRRLIPYLEQEINNRIKKE